MFTKNEKSSFSYWFAHWCAYQMTALNLKCWKFKYLFHDMEKPWLKLLWGDYDKVRKWHRTHNKHHITYKDPSKIDWEGAVIDWECSRFTKKDAPMTGRETFDYFINVRYKENRLSKELADLMMKNVPPILEKLGL